MAKDYIPLGDVAARDVAMIEIRCGRCDRHGRLSVNRPCSSGMNRMWQCTTTCLCYRCARGPDDDCAAQHSERHLFQ